MAGRPTKYNKKILEIAEDYLKNYNTEYEHLVPSIAGLSLVLRVSRATLYNWAEAQKKEEDTSFLDILEDIKKTQYLVTLHGGLGGDFNSAIAKLLLGKHGLTEKTQQDVTTGGEKLSNNFIIQPVKAKSDKDE